MFFVLLVDTVYISGLLEGIEMKVSTSYDPLFLDLLAKLLYQDLKVYYNLKIQRRYEGSILDKKTIDLIQIKVMHIVV